MAKDGFGKKVEGAIEKTSGKVKEALGNATDNQSLKREGQKEQLKGNVKEKAGQAQQNWEDATKKH